MKELFFQLFGSRGGAYATRANTPITSTTTNSVVDMTERRVGGSDESADCTSRKKANAVSTPVSIWSTYRLLLLSGASFFVGWYLALSFSAMLSSDAMAMARSIMSFMLKVVFLLSVMNLLTRFRNSKL